MPSIGTAPVKDGTKLASMVGEVMDELGESTGLSDNEQLLEKTLRDSKARRKTVSARLLQSCI